jgi:hypothetical protein
LIYGDKLGHIRVVHESPRGSFYARRRLTDRKRLQRFREIHENKRLFVTTTAPRASFECRPLSER